MSFSVSYVYKIIDKFTPKLKEIERTTNQFNKTVLNMQSYIDRSNRAITSITPVIKNYGRAIDEVNKKQIKLSTGKGFEKLQGLGGSLSGLAGSVGAGMVLKSTASAAIDLESSVIDLKKVLDFTSENAFKDFQTELAGIAKQSAVSQTAINQLAYTAAKLGIEKSDIASFAKLTGNVGIAFKMPLDEATDAVADLKVKLNLSQAELQSTLDTLNHLDDKTNASGRGMLNIMSRLTGVMKSMNVPPEVAASFAAVAEQLAPKGSPELGASGLRMFIAGLQDIKKVSPEIGTALNRDFAGTIDKVLTKLREMPDAARNISIRETFGDEAAPFIMNLVKSQDLLNKTLGFGADKTAALGSMEREVARQRESAKFKLDTFKSSMLDLGATIGTATLPALKDFVDKLSPMIVKLGELAANNPVLVQFAAAALGMIAVAAPLGIALTAISGGFAVLSASMVLLTGPIGITIAGVTYLASVLYRVYNASEDVRNSIAKIGRLGENLGSALAMPWKAGEYLSRDVGYDYDDKGNKINPIDEKTKNFENMSNFLNGTPLSSNKEQNMSLDMSMVVQGRDGASASNISIDRAFGVKLGNNMVGLK